jgi:hypothetical protein
MKFIENNIEEYIEENFTNIPKNTVEVVENKSEYSLLEEAIKYQIENMGSYTICPFSFNWNQHSKIYTILAAIRKFTNDVSVSSCRLDAIARDPYLAKLVSEFDTSGIVVAVEGISHRIRNFLQKGILEEDILRAVDTIFKYNVKKIKFYYIYTGLENEEDLKEFEYLVKIIDELRRKYNRESITVLFSFTYLSPTLYTSLQYNASKTVEEALSQYGNTLMMVKRLLTTYGFDFRTSVSRSCNDIIEFSDRRAAGLLEYVSLNGIYTNDIYQVYFYDGETKITKEEFDKYGGNKLEIDGTFYKVDFLEKFTNTRIYKIINENTAHSVVSLDQINEIFKKYCNSGERFNDKFLAYFGRRKDILSNRKIYLESRKDTDNLIFKYSNGQEVKTLNVTVGVNKLVIDFMRDHLPIFTGGVSYNDIIQEKNSMYIFPHYHIKFHKNRHLGYHWYKYLSSKEGLFDSYCLSGILSQCVQCGSCDTKEEIKSIVSRKHEFGKEAYQKIVDAKVELKPKYKIWIDVEVESGKYSAMRSEWLEMAVTRAILKASDGELTDSLLHNKLWHTRKNYKALDEQVELISGKMRFEYQFSDKVEFTEEYVKRIFAKINNYTTKGWSITDIKLKSGDFNLKQDFDFILIQFLFNSKRLKIDTGKLREFRERFYSKDFILKFKTINRINRKIVKKSLEELDKNVMRHSKILEGKDQDDLILQVVLKSDINPILFLDAFLGNKGSQYIKFVETKVIGFRSSVNIKNIQEVIKYGGQKLKEF